MTPAYGQSELVKKLCAEFQTTDTCAVHVRGGDIVGPGRAFFERALARMEKERSGLRYLVFTNDRGGGEGSARGRTHRAEDDLYLRTGSVFGYR